MSMTYLDWADGIHIRASNFHASTLFDEKVNISLENGENETFTYQTVYAAGERDWKDMLPGFGKIDRDQRRRFFDALCEWMISVEDDYPE